MATTEELDKQALEQAFATLLERTDTITEAAARHGISQQTLRRLIQRGEVERIMVGRDVRVWR